MMGVLPTLLVIGLLAGAAQPAEPPALVRARALYNDGDYEGAIAAALQVRDQPRAADAADLVRARALLELHRRDGGPDRLVEARALLAGIDAAVLSARDRVDLLVGLGQSLYLDGRPGAAAEIFASALGATPLLAAPERLRVLDWWATSVDQDAQAQPADRRLRAYQRMVDRMDEELRIDPANPIANYWLAAGARGAGDLARAWHAAAAGWVRASLNPSTSARLRADLDRLVTEALIPERVRTYPAPERDDARAALQAEWHALRSEWPRHP